MDLRLAGRSLAGPTLYDLPHDDRFDCSGIDARPTHRVTDDHGT